MITTALVLAGSRGGRDPVADHVGVSDKALIPIVGATMLARVVGALESAGFTRTLVSTNSPAVKDEARRAGATAIAAAAGPSASTALALLGSGAPLLVTTADHALIRPEWITDFVARVPADADVAVLLARREAVEHAAAGTRRTYLRFADGHWSGCNMFLLATPASARMLDLWQQVERDRKRPWRIVRRLGPGLLLRYLVGRLTLADAVAHLGRQAGVRAAIVEARDGLAAVDVDKPDDLDFVLARLAAQPDPLRDRA